MRHRYLVTYDIADDKRLRRIHRCLSGYGDPLQYSVFQCDLSKQERVLMMEAVHKIIHHRDDQVLIIDLGPAEGRGEKCIEAMGRALEVVIRRGVVV